MLNRVKLNHAKLNRAFVIRKKLPYGYYGPENYYYGYLNSIEGYRQFESEKAYLDYLKDYEEEES